MDQNEEVSDNAQAVELVCKMFDKTPRRITAVDRYKRRLESTTETWEYGDIIRGADSIKRDVFWLAGTESEKYLWQFIAESRCCIEGKVANFIQRQQAFSDAQQIVMVGCSPEQSRTDGKIGGIQEITGIRASHAQEISRVRKNYQPLKAQDIAEGRIELYGRLLHVEQKWAADLFLYEIPGAFVGAGKIAVRQFIETLGRVIKMFKEHSTKAEQLSAELDRLEAARTIITQIAQEVF